MAGDDRPRWLPSTFPVHRYRPAPLPGPDPDEVFEQQYLRFVAAWAISDLEDVHRRGRWKRWLVCWWAHGAPEVPPHRACWACTARWVR